MVSSYLVHHGYCATATAFARMTETPIQEEQASIKNRQSKDDYPLPLPSLPHLSLLFGSWQPWVTCLESVQLRSSSEDQPTTQPWALLLSLFQGNTAPEDCPSMGMSLCRHPNAHLDGRLQAGPCVAGYPRLHACLLPLAFRIPCSPLFMVFWKECVCILPVQCPALSTIYSTSVMLPTPGQRGDEVFRWERLMFHGRCGRTLSPFHLCSCPLPLEELKEAFLVFVLACLLRVWGSFVEGGCGERGNSPEKRSSEGRRVGESRGVWTMCLCVPACVSLILLSLCMWVCLCLPENLCPAWHTGRDPRLGVCE